MALQNTLRVQVDKPVWEWTRFAPLVSSAVSTSCSADNSTFHPNNGRYIYYLISATSFWRYDTWTDSYLQLASPPVAPLSWASMRFAGGQGYRNRVLSAGSNTLTAGIYGPSLVGFDIKITGGTGMGQRRVITSVADAVVAESGVASAASTSSVGDSTKTWASNQWVGYVMRVTYGSGLNISRKIVYNTVNVLTTVDSFLYTYDQDYNPAPMTGVSSTAGVQTFYSVESTTLTVDTPWDVVPDATSRFTILSGAIYLISSSASAPFYTFQRYDVASDTWYSHASSGNLISAAATDCRLERAGDNATVWERGRATSGSATTLVDTGKQWNVNQWVGYNVRIFSGTGRGTLRAVTSNTSNTLTIASGTALDSTSYYYIEGFDTGTATAGSTTVLTDSTKAWTTNQWKNFNLVITGGTGMGQAQTIGSSTGTTLTVARPFATAPDSTSTYSIRGDSDKMWVAFGGYSQLFHQDLESDLMTVSRQVDAGLARPGAAQYADFPPIPISVGSYSGGVMTVSTGLSHNLKSGMLVKHTGDTGPSASFNNITATITVVTISTYTYPVPGSSASMTLPAPTTTTLTDASKNWTTNQWAGYLVTYCGSGSPAALSYTAQIASNTATTLTFVAATAVAPSAGTSRYAIHPRPSFGSQDAGIATGTQSTTTLQDTSKTWAVNQWAGKRLRLTGGTGLGIEVSIASNTSNTLTFGVTTAPVTANTTYSILGVPVRGTGLCLEWASGISDVSTRGRYIFSARGGAVVGFDRYDIPTDTWLPLNMAPQVESLTTGSMYAYDGGDRLYFTKEVTQRVYYLDLKTSWLHGASIYPYTAGTAILGNRMEIFQTTDGLKYMWLNRHSNLECFMQLCFY